MKMIIFASTNDSVQFHETILMTFLNRKFSMYFDNDNEIDDFDDDVDNYIDGDFISNIENDDDAEMMGLNLKRKSTESQTLKKKAKQSKKTKKPSIKKNQTSCLVDVFALYGKQHTHIPK